MNRLLLFFFLFFASSARLSATHIVGGEVTYKCLGNNLYEITLVVYRDCYTGVPWFDNPASVGIFDSNWSLKKELKLNWDPTSNDTLPIILSDPCLTVPPDVCAHGTTYKATVELPKIPGGYSIVYQRCCRNQLIRNIIRPLGTGITAVAYISEDALDACNSSAVFNQWPPVAICIHQPIDFDHSASDPDDDSLVYRLCTPLHGADSIAPVPQPPNAGPYQEVKWRDPPYNLLNMLGGEPLTIDPATGFLTGVPNLIGNFVVGVCVDEYRDGEFISTTRRDFQYNVSDCGQPLAAFFVPEVVCDTLTVKFLNQGLNTHDYQWYFNWGADSMFTSNEYSPTFKFPDTGFYEVLLIAESKPTCRDTFSKTIYLTDSYIDALLNFTFPDCDENGMIVQAVDLSKDPVFGIANWQWTLTGPSGFSEQSAEQNPDFLVTEPGQYRLKLVTTSGNGCMDMVSFLFFPPIPPIHLLLDSVVICPGDTVALYPGADASFQHTWSPATAISDTTAANPFAFPLETTNYEVTITADNNPCLIEKTVKVIVVNTGGLEATAEPDTIFLGNSSQLAALMPGFSNFFWEPSNSLSNPNIANPVASPTVTTTYTVTVPISSTCEIRDTVRVVVRSTFCEEPFVFFPTGFSPNNDGENDELKLESNVATEVYWVIYNRWGEKIFEADSLDDAWDGTFKGQPQPAESYGYYLRVGCVGGEVFEKKGNVTLLR
jgi:gliding motility-associated-like protein